MNIYETILGDVLLNNGGLFFVYGYGGTEKTFLWRALSAKLRSKGDIVINVAASGIASLLLLGGRTAHSRFAIQIPLNEDSTCTRQDIVGATINSSYLWDTCKVLRLTKNLRLNRMELGVDLQQVEDFAKWIAFTGDGTTGGPNDGYADVNSPPNMLLPSTGDHIATIVDSTFPMLKNGGCDHKYLESHTILAPTLDVVTSINEYMSHLHVAKSKTYFSCDTVCKSDSSDGILADVHTLEFLNGLRASGIPNHALTLKVGSPVMLLRNIDHSMGLCNGTRLVITKLSEHVVQEKIVFGNNCGTRVLIPRMSMTPTDIRLHFKFQRRQFLLMLSYVMNINKSQGQALSHVGLLLKKPVFVHGQLYVAASRVSNPNGLKILIGNEGDTSCTSTTNVVYHEVFNNL
ncbi:PREDICTED: uncharacterized protein LOC109184141 [Ipomoea nil]|uniref:uncharacterized protein LOC109184141 n=1 Tax=Ipomoea nil TaxID=35883 RepID=UPI000901F11B|nr:PREDICTED: uncharacterized protein LOC109184141 [Ipomoea nil]